jgi:drug/metabolite transporter (DMT)-like permease
LTVVQPLLGMGLLVPLAFGARALGERVRKRDILNVCMLIAGVSLLVAVAPPKTTAAAVHLRLAIALGSLAAVVVVASLLTAVLRSQRGVMLIVAAGTGFALASITTKLLADAFTRHAWIVLGAWLALTAGVGAVALIGEMNALQVLAATTVSSLVFMLETVVPVSLSPFLFSEHGRGSAVTDVLRVVALAATIGAAFALTRTGVVAEALAE